MKGGHVTTIIMKMIYIIIINYYERKGGVGNEADMSYLRKLNWKK